MKPRGGLSLSTRWGDFYGYKLNLFALSQFMGFWRKGRAFSTVSFCTCRVLAKKDASPRKWGYILFCLF